MFGLGWVELSIVAILLLVIIGSGRFPGAARQAGQAAGLFTRYRKQWMKLKSLLRLRL